MRNRNTLKLSILVALALTTGFGGTAFAATNRDRTSADSANTTPPAGTTIRDCGECPELVVVPPGSYVRGASGNQYTEPTRRIDIGYPFAAGRYEVTRGQFATFVAQTGHEPAHEPRRWCRTAIGERQAGRTWRTPGFPQTDIHPAVCVARADALAYVAWLTQRTGHVYRLPSETEWEYMARAGIPYYYPWLTYGSAEQCRNANGFDEALANARDDVPGAPANCNDDHVYTAPVGTYAPNPFGIHDALGNAWEWTEDCGSVSYRFTPSNGDPTTPPVGQRCDGTPPDTVFRLRGGSWASGPGTLSPAVRWWWNCDGSRGCPGYTDSSVGFRVVRELRPPTSQTLSLVLPDSPARQGFIRIRNRSSHGAMITITGTDDSGATPDPVYTFLAAHETRHFNSRDLEQGNTAKGLNGSLGDGEGAWRLKITSEADLHALAYVRTADGFVTAVDDVVPRTAAPPANSYRIPIFNPGRNENQTSALRLANPTGSDATVTITAEDDDGAPGPGGSVRLALRAGESRRISSRELESGNSTIDGKLGTGTGKWELVVAADQPIEVVNLLENPTGHLSNLSTSSTCTSPGPSNPAQCMIALFTGANAPQQSFLRVRNRSDESGTVEITATDDEGTRRGPVTLTMNPREARHLNSDDLEQGNDAKGLVEGIGEGEGHWRLALSSNLPIDATAYIRTATGFLSTTLGTARLVKRPFEEIVHEVPFFNPASNPNQVSTLRIINMRSDPVEVRIHARDDRGRLAPEGEVAFTLAENASWNLSARELESGGPDLDGRLGDGTGKWTLFVTTIDPPDTIVLDHHGHRPERPIGGDDDPRSISERTPQPTMADGSTVPKHIVGLWDDPLPIIVMSLLGTTDDHLANLSGPAIAPEDDPGRCSEADRVTRIPDPRVRAALEKATKTTPGQPITHAQLMSLKQLDLRAIRGEDIDLAGLECALGAMELSLHGTRVSDISVVANLIHLDILSLAGNPLLADLNPIAGLPWLRSLKLHENRQFGINGSASLDGAVLASLPSLEVFSMVHADLSDISALAHLPQSIRWIQLWGNGIEDISPLLQIKGLGRGDQVELQGNPLSNESLTVHIPELERRGVNVQL